MSPLASLGGTWDLVTLSKGDSGKWSPSTEISARRWAFAPILQGTMIQGRGEIEFPGGLRLEALVVLSFDQWNRVYRAALMGSAFGLMDIYAGEWNDAGELVLSNAETGSAQSTPTQDATGQVRLAIESEDVFSMILAQSVDAGATWVDFLKWEFVRRQP